MIPEFKAWDKKERKMKEVSSLNWGNGLKGVEVVGDVCYEHLMISDVELLQYTGREIDGIEIHDQHILKPVFELDDGENNPVCVYYSEENARWKVAGLGGTYDLDIYLDLICGERGTKIIGTSFENPEFLGELK